MKNIRQTDHYAQYMRTLNWTVECIHGTYVFIKKVLFIHTVMEMFRPTTFPTTQEISSCMKKHHSKALLIEPLLSPPPYPPQTLSVKKVSYSYTKNIIISLTPKESDIFSRFSEAKRRAVRKAQKLGVQIETSNDINSFLHLKNQTADFFLGKLTTSMFTKKLWKAFSPDHAKVVLAYDTDHNELLSGILLLWEKDTAYYWMAAASPKGKHVSAPSLCVWEALRYAKSQGCTLFDFEGIHDERFPGRNEDWKGFSKFKEGFGGKVEYYSEPCIYKQK